MTISEIPTVRRLVLVLTSALLAGLFSVLGATANASAATESAPVAAAVPVATDEPPKQLEPVPVTVEPPADPVDGLLGAVLRTVLGTVDGLLRTVDGVLQPILGGSLLGGLRV